jgi:GNAT superfamily N-acetyltransferase
VIVRWLTAGDDLAVAIQLLQRFFREEGFATPADVIAANAAKLAGLDACALFVAEADGAAAGVAAVSMEFGIEYGWSAEMGDLYVVPEHRRKGIAAALVEAIEAFLRGKAISHYQVTVTQEAEAAHGLGRFYRQLGFSGAGRAVLFKAL